MDVLRSRTRTAERAPVRPSRAAVRTFSARDEATRRRRNGSADPARAFGRNRSVDPLPRRSSGTKEVIKAGKRSPLPWRCPTYRKRLPNNVGCRSYLRHRLRAVRGRQTEIYIPSGQEVKMPCLRAGRANSHAQSGSELYAILPISKRTFSYHTRPGSRHGPGQGIADARSSLVGAIRPSWLTRTLAPGERRRWASTSARADVSVAFRAAVPRRSSSTDRIVVRHAGVPGPVPSRMPDMRPADRVTGRSYRLCVFGRESTARGTRPKRAGRGQVGLT